MTEHITDAEIERLERMLDGTYDPPPPRQVDPERVALFGGLPVSRSSPPNTNSPED